MFSSCDSLVTIEKLLFNSIKTSSMWGAFRYSPNLENIVIEGTIKVNSGDLNLSDCNKLTIDSIMSFINAFEDNTGETQYVVTFGYANIKKLSPEQIAIATNKNILLA